MKMELIKERISALSDLELIEWAELKNSSSIPANHPSRKLMEDVYGEDSQVGFMQYLTLVLVPTILDVMLERFKVYSPHIGL